MPSNDNHYDLSEKYRPRNLGQVVGQDKAVKLLQKYIDTRTLPHALLLTGPSGVGKTTLSRILRSELGCEDDTDYQEVDCASVEDPIGAVRSIRTSMQSYPMKRDGCRIWLLDEVQALSRAKFSQQAMLRMLEGVPSHVYFFLATTDPSKLIDTIRTRCTLIPLKAVDDDSIYKRLSKIATKEKAEISEMVLSKIVSMSNGSVRLAERNLGKVIQLDNEEEQLEAITSIGAEKDAKNMVFMMVWNRRARFKDVAKLIDEVDGDDWDGLRRWVLSCATIELLKANRATMEKAYQVIMAFETSGTFFDTGKAGKASFTRAAYECMKK